MKYKDYYSIIPPSFIWIENMDKHDNLFQKEETMLQEALAVLEEFSNSHERLAIKYCELVAQYKKLLKQTKVLVKISDRQQRDKINEAQQTTISNEKRLAQFLEAIPLGIFVVDRERKPYYANQAAFEIFRISHNSPKSLTDLLALYDQSIEQLTYHSNKQYFPLEQALLCGKAGTEELDLLISEQLISLELSSIPIFDQKGNVSYAIVILENICERKQAETIQICHHKEIEEKNQQLIQLNQEKDEFLSIVAHDLKNPLGNIMSLAEIILENQSIREIYDYTIMIKSSAKAVFALVTNLLDVNAIESGKINLSIGQHDILPIVSELLNHYKPQTVSKNLTIHFPAPQTQYIALIDKNITRQILDNLISNAIKYSPLGKNIYLYLIVEPNLLRCEIEDEGPGLSTEEISKLFTKFSRLKPQPTGGEHSTGLGLFIVRKLVEKMHGKVWCESQLGQGSKFIVAFKKEEEE